MSGLDQRSAGGLLAAIGGMAAGAALWCAPASAAETVGADGPHRHDSSTAPTGSAVKLDVLYTADLWRNLRGGLRRGGAYLDNLDVVLEVDAERAFGWSGVTLLASGLYNNDQTFSEPLLGDLQTVSNIDADDATRLYEAWVDKDWGGGALKVGVVDLNSEFDVNETGALFMNSAHGVGPDLSQVGANGPSIFPITGAAARLTIRPADGWEVKLGAFDGVPGSPQNPRLTRFDLSSEEGALLIGEVAARRGEDGFRVALGAWRHTGAMDDFEAIDEAGAPGATKGSSGGYLLVESAARPIGAGEARAFARLGVADARRHPVARYLGGGVAYVGPILGIGEESAGFAVATARLGEPFRRAAALAGAPLERREVALELTYRTQVTSGLAIQPDVQYVINPGADPARRDAIVVGVRLEFSPKALVRR